MAIIFHALARLERETRLSSSHPSVVWPAKAVVSTTSFGPSLQSMATAGVALLLAGMVTGTLLPMVSQPRVQVALPAGVRLAIPPLPRIAVPEVALQEPSEPGGLAALPPAIAVAPRTPKAVPLPKDPAPLPKEAVVPPPVAAVPASQQPTVPRGPVLTVPDSGVPAQPAQPKTETPSTISPVPAAPASQLAWAPKVSVGAKPGAATEVAISRTTTMARPLPDGGLEIATSLYRDASARQLGLSQKPLLPAQQRQYQDALLDLEHLKIREPNSAPIALQLGLLQARLGGIESGIAEIRRAAQLQSESPTYKLCLAIVLDFAGQRREAASLYQETQRIITEGAGEAWRAPLPISLVEVRDRILTLQR